MSLGQTMQIFPSSSGINSSVPPETDYLYLLNNSCNSRSDTCTYSWSVTNGQIIGADSGRGRQTVLVRWDNYNGNGTLSASVTNCTDSCNTSVNYSIPIRYLGNISNIKINGTAYSGTYDLPCSTTPFTASVDPVTNATNYSWSFASGGVGWSISGSGNSVTVTPSTNTPATLRVTVTRSDVSSISRIMNLSFSRPLASISSISTSNILLCNTSSTISVSALGTNADQFRWTPTANVKINGSSSVTTTAGSVNVSATGTGSFTVNAYSNTCGVSSNSVTGLVKYGTPRAPQSMVVMMGPTANQLCLNSPMTIAIGNLYQADDNVTQYNWSMGGWSSYFTGYSGPSIASQRADFFLTSSSPTSQTIFTNAQNACGTSGTFSANFLAVTCGSFLVSYPNPASDVVTLSFQESTDKLPDEITLYSDKNSKKVFSISYEKLLPLVKQERTLQIPVKNLARGTYYLHVLQNSKTEKVRINLE